MSTILISYLISYGAAAWGALVLVAVLTAWVGTR